MYLYSFIQTQKLYLKCIKITTKFLVNESPTNLASIMNVFVQSSEAVSEKSVIAVDECSLCLYCEPYPLAPIHVIFTSRSLYYASL